MTGIESIKEKIFADCAAECERIAEASRQEIARIREENERHIAEYREKLDGETDRRTEQTDKITESTVSLAVRKEMLAAKRGLLDEVFELALARLEACDAQQYRAMLVDMLAGCSVSGGETVHLSAAADKLLGDSVIGEMSAACGKPLTAGKPTDEIRGGFILNGPDSRQICSFETALATLREDLEPEVAGILF